MAPMKYGYAWEKLSAAVQTLAASDLPLQQRLAAAWIYSGSRLAHSPSPYLPTDLQARYDELHADLTKIDDPNAGAINATCAAMSDEAASSIAERIVSLYDATCAAYYGQQD
jgi:hypothetical protein